MSEERTTPDLIEPRRRLVASDGNLEAVLSFHAPDPGLAV
jgi:hypothetical protein